MSKGTKKDDGKAPIHLIPTEAILAMAKGFEYGAKKYGEYNFRNGIEYTRLLNSLMRHSLAFLAGEDIDEESQLSHIDLIGSNFAMLKYMETHKKDMDNRYKSLGKQLVTSLREAVEWEKDYKEASYNVLDDDEEDINYSTADILKAGEYVMTKKQYKEIRNRHLKKRKKNNAAKS